MADDGAIHVRKELSDALADDALAEEAIARHLDARKTLAHFAALKADADLDLLDRVLAAQGGESPAEDDRAPAH